MSFLKSIRRNARIAALLVGASTMQSFAADPTPLPNNASLDLKVAESFRTTPAKTGGSKWGYFTLTVPQTIFPEAPAGQPQTICTEQYRISAFTEELKDCPPWVLEMLLSLSNCSPGTLIRDASTLTVSSSADPNFIVSYVKDKPSIQINNIGQPDANVPEIVRTPAQAYQTITPADVKVNLADYRVLPGSVLEARREEAIISNYIRGEAAPKSMAVVSRVPFSDGTHKYLIVLDRVNNDTNELSVALKAWLTFTKDEAILDLINDGSYDFKASKQAGTASLFISPEIKGGHWSRDNKIDNQEKEYSNRTSISLFKLGTNVLYNGQQTPAPTPSPAPEPTAGEKYMQNLVDRLSCKKYNGDTLTAENCTQPVNAYSASGLTGILQSTAPKGSVEFYLKNVDSNGGTIEINGGALAKDAKVCITGPSVPAETCVGHETNYKIAPVRF